MFEEDGKALLILELRQGGVTDRRVIDAMERVPRELFVPEALREQAYENIRTTLHLRCRRRCKSEEHGIGSDRIGSAQHP